MYMPEPWLTHSDPKKYKVDVQYMTTVVASLLPEKVKAIIDHARNQRNNSKPGASDKKVDM